MKLILLPFLFLSLYSLAQATIDTAEHNYPRGEVDEMWERYKQNKLDSVQGGPTRDQLVKAYKKVILESKTLKEYDEVTACYVHLCTIYRDDSLYVPSIKASIAAYNNNKKSKKNYSEQVRVAISLSRIWCTPESVRQSHPELVKTLDSLRSIILKEEALEENIKWGVDPKDPDGWNKISPILKQEPLQLGITLTVKILMAIVALYSITFFILLFNRKIENKTKWRLATIGFMLFYILIFCLPFILNTCDDEVQIFSGFEIKASVIAHLLFFVCAILDISENRPTKKIKVISVILASVLLFYLITVFYLFIEVQNLSFSAKDMKFKSGGGCIHQLNGYTFSFVFASAYLGYTIWRFLLYKKGKLE